MNRPVAQLPKSLSWYVSSLLKSLVRRQSTSSMKQLSMFTYPLVSNCNTKPYIVAFILQHDIAGYVHRRQIWARGTCPQ